jgi:lipoprotein NlpI
MFSKLFGGKSTRDLFERGVEHYQNGNPEAAVDTLSDAIAKEKSKSVQDKKFLSDLFCIRGEVYLSVGVAILSQSDFANAIQCNPENESAMNNLGIWFSIPAFSTPDYETSLEYFDKALALQPERKDIQLNRACVKIRSGDKTGCDDLRKLDGEGYPDAKIALQRFCDT